MLEINKIHKQFKDFQLNNINFKVEKGDYFVLLGVSGSGKSVLLEIIAGLISPDNGAIILEGNDITHVKIQKRKVGLVFQDFAVFPHMTVKENIAFPLKGSGISMKEIDIEVLRLAKIVDIPHLLERKPQSLSGGERQRIVLARILALKPSILLLDEPLASLDIQLRHGLRGLLRQLNRNGQTIIHVTHDYEEAIALANRVAVIDNGIVIQCGDAEEVFRNPCCTFIANFIGIKNFYEGYLEKDNYLGQRKASINSKIILNILSDAEEGKGSLMIRSEDILISEKEPDSALANSFNGSVVDILPSRLGYEVVVDIGIKITVLVSRLTFENLYLKEKKKVWISFMSSAVKYIRS